MGEKHVQRLASRRETVPSVAAGFAVPSISAATLQVSRASAAGLGLRCMSDESAQKRRWPIGHPSEIGVSRLRPAAELWPPMVS
jgi:hypothetical protein